MANQYTKQIDWWEVFKKYSPFKYTSKEIADKIGVHPTTVRKAKNRLGIKTKKQYWLELFKKYPPDTYTLKEIAFEAETTEWAVSKAINRYLGKRKKRVYGVEYLQKLKEKRNESRNSKNGS